MKRLLSVWLACAVLAAACGGSDADSTASDAVTSEATVEAPAEPTAEPAAEPDPTEAAEPEPDAEPAPTEAAEPEPEPTEVVVSADEPVVGGTLIAAVTGDPGHFNPGITTGFEVHAVTGSMFNGLVELDDNANPQPDLATSWEVSDDSTVYTFHLAEGVQWHDGEPFTSADVKFTFENILLQFHSRTKGGLENILESIETPDDNTVVFTFSEPYAALLQRMNSTEAPILAQHIYEGVADVQTADENLNPIGTGPFVFESYDLDDQVTVVRNENYFKDGLPYLDKVIFRVIPDDNTQLLALEQGEVDYIWRVPGAEVERIRAEDAITLYNVSSGPGGGFCIPTLAFNLDREVFDDIRVRQAIAQAIDREQLVTQVLFGDGKAATGPISSKMVFAYTSDVTVYPLDLDAARALLDDAGLTGEPRLTLNLVLLPSFEKYGEVIKQNLAEIGIELEITPLDRSAFLPRIFADRDWDMNIISYCNNADPSIGVSRMYLSTNIGDIPFSNAAGYVNPQIDELFAQAASTADPAERGAVYGDIQRLLVDELPYWWLVETDFVVASGSNVHGLLPNSGHFAEGAWLAEG